MIVNQSLRAFCQAYPVVGLPGDGVVVVECWVVGGGWWKMCEWCVWASNVVESIRV